MDVVGAYRAVSKRIFLAYPTYSDERHREIVVLADDAAEARAIASDYLKVVFVTVRALTPTDNPQTYKIWEEGLM